MSFLDEILDNVGKPFNQSKGFERGTHEVIIGEVEATKKDTAKMKDAPIVRVTVFDEKDNDKSAICTLYFHTEGGAKMSVAKVLGLLVHSVGEEKKDAVRDLGKKVFGSVSTPAEARDLAAKVLNDKLIGKKGYLVADPQGNYQTTSYGDLWHYPYELAGETKPAVDLSTAETVPLDELPNFDEV